MPIRDAWRALRATPAVTAVSLFILTAGIAAATITFSIVDAVILRSLPFDDSGRIVVVGPDQPYIRTHSHADFMAWRDRADAFESLAATSVGPMTHVPSASGVEQVRAWEVTASLFDVLRVRPVIGRVFTRDNEVDGRHLVAVVSYDVWARNFGSDPGIVGRSIRLADPRDPEQAVSTVEILGVMPKGFTYPFDVRPGVWIPHVAGGPNTSRGNYLQVVGRLRDGATLTEAQAQLEGIRGSVAAAAGRPLRQDRRPVPMPLYGVLVREVKGWMLMALSVVTIAMLVACGNVAILMLVRSARRARELAVRASLGASPRQLAAVLLAESLMLSLGAAVLGVAVAWWGLDAAIAVLPGGLPRADDIAIDLRVLIVTASAAIGTGVLFGVVPAWQGARVQPLSLVNAAGHTVTSGRGRWLAAFVVGEVALVSTLLVVSAMFVASFVRVVRVDLGFTRANVATFDLADYTGRTMPILEALRQTPGVVSVAELASSPPLVMAAFGGDAASVRLRVADDPDAGLSIAPTRYRVTPEYFATAGIQLLRGRTFTEADAGAPVAIIDELAARVLFSDGRDPIGARVSRDPSLPPLTVVGIVRTVSPDGPERVSGTQLYLPIADGSGGTPRFVVRTSGPVDAVVPAIQASLDRVLPAGMPAPLVRSLDDAFRVITAGRRATAALMSVFGLAVLIIGAAGVYAVMAAVVSQRQRELGVRIALGATRARIIGGVLTRASAYLAAGLVVGLLAGRVFSGAFVTLLFQVRPGDVSTYAVVAALLIGGGLCAAFLPAWRAARVDPIATLRSQ
jgi:putative ABC transport system permease protein